MFVDHFVLNPDNPDKFDDRMTILIVGRNNLCVEAVRNYLYLACDMDLYKELEEILNESI